jgi:hypothetical protein
MDEMDVDTVRAAAQLLYAASLLQLTALAALLALRSAAAARVGQVRTTGRGPRRWRWIGLGGLALLALLVLLVPGVPAAPSLTLLGISAVLVILTPAPGDSAVGSGGARAGWHAARFADFAEWRLTGEHLRWRQSDLWLASHAPREHHAALRVELERLAPERESRFKA